MVPDKIVNSLGFLLTNSKLWQNSLTLPEHNLERV
jgi:hypothetical protein